MPDPTPPPAPRLTELSEPVFADDRATLHLGDAVELLPLLPEASIDALVTDPPYGLSFNGHAWDDATGFRESLPHVDTSAMSAPEVFETWCTAWAAGALWALKPGAHLAAFGGTRTWHRMVRGIENAGFEIRDQIAWLHTTGMPKSMDLSHALDKHDGAQRTDRIVQTSNHDGVLGATRTVLSKGTPVTADAKRWEGWGTALRPAFEPIIIARKPPGGKIVGNILKHGVGGINIDGGRFADDRWPTNVAFDADQADALDVLTGTWQGESLSRKFPIFRFEHKPSPAERPRAFGISHSTVKPLGLMRWLVTLVTPPGGTVLEPFAGSGTTVEAAKGVGFHVVAVERDPSFVPLIISRLDR
ncbi:MULTISPECIES: site-specific DNA-methyltransferase [unclassified Microbacterium]|uniref:DNA-methyltransferase n=1 Tax=unclassified Microbacterium TaxID=2609290 RepID=UPI000EAA1526|nr:MULTISPECIES: site-specific DNA-methyltransferase [unclassified Microbacterium]MBT2486601.1 site-specific DNA-methyltransferase [Microbacterium sp. ISL-108]RKN69286.1 site-specific DNA-methyltransferase [Microbacterium sp. CGR2]